MTATTTRQRRLAEAALAPTPAPSRVPKREVYARLSLAIRRGERDRARAIYYDEILPDRRFSRGEVTRLSYRLGAIDEGDRYLATCDDL